MTAPERRFAVGAGAEGAREACAGRSTGLPAARAITSALFGDRGFRRRDRERAESGTTVAGEVRAEEGDFASICRDGLACGAAGAGWLPQRPPERRRSPEPAGAAGG